MSGGVIVQLNAGHTCYRCLAEIGYILKPLSSRFRSLRIEVPAIVILAYLGSGPQRQHCKAERTTPA